MSDSSSEIEPITRPPSLLSREPVVLQLHREEIESIAKSLEAPLNPCLDPEGHLVDSLGNTSQLVTGELAQGLSEGGYAHLSQFQEVSRGRVSVCRDAGRVVLKEGVYADTNNDRYRLVIAFRHIGQSKDIQFFSERLGERHVPPTEALVMQGRDGPINLIVQKKVEGKHLNEIEDLNELSTVQQDELLHLLGEIQTTYEDTGRFPDIHGRPLKGVRGFRKMDIRHTDNIMVDENNAWLIDTDDIARSHSEETFRGWLACKMYPRKIQELRSKLTTST